MTAEQSPLSGDYNLEWEWADDIYTLEWRDYMSKIIPVIEEWCQTYNHLNEANVATLVSIDDKGYCIKMNHHNVSSSLDEPVLPYGDVSDNTDYELD